jgi:prepilin-type processing-associated H-X9-DG protein
MDESPFLDMSRPLSRWMSPSRVTGPEAAGFCCPADRGITGEASEFGTGRRTACRSFGTSYRGNAPLFDARLAGITDEPRGIRREEITATPSRLLVIGDAGWYENAEATGRNADWHGRPGYANLLFLDGSVRFREVLPRGQGGPVVFDPIPSGPTIPLPTNSD